MTELAYLHLPSGQLPSDNPRGPFRAVVVIEEVVSDDWRNAVSQWLVRNGCLYMTAWGLDCSKWDDSLDWANLAAFEYGEIPKDDFVMTTWHENESLAEAFWFSGHCARHPTIELSRTLIVDICLKERGQELLDAYWQAQESDPPPA